MKHDGQPICPIDEARRKEAVKKGFWFKLGFGVTALLILAIQSTVIMFATMFMHHAWEIGAGLTFIESAVAVGLLYILRFTFANLKEATTL